MKHKQKIIFAFTILGLATLLCFCDRLTGELWCKIALYLGGFFIGANIAVKAIPLFMKGNSDGKKS